MKLRHFSITQQGQSHIEHNTNCQDHSDSVFLNNKVLGQEIVVAAIADGLGSCDFSEIGSKIAVTTVINFLTEALSRLQSRDDEVILGMLRKAYNCAVKNIETEADQRQLPFLLFDTTLTTAIVFSDGVCYYGHIGDDGIVALFCDGSYRMVTTRNEGEQASSVIPLSQKKDWSFEKLSASVASVVLMTDGVLDSAVGSSQFCNRIFYPFFKPVFENIMKTADDVNYMRDFWDKYLGSDTFRSRVTDDISFAVVQNTWLLSTVKPVPFNEKKWEEDTERFQKEKEKALGYTVAKQQKAADTPKNDASEIDIPYPYSVNKEPIYRDEPQQIAEKKIVSNLPNIPVQTAPVHANPRRSQKAPKDNHNLLLAIAGLCVVLVVLSGIIFNKVGHKNGYALGKKDGYYQGYDAGYLDGKTTALELISKQEQNNDDQTVYGLEAANVTDETLVGKEEQSETVVPQSIEQTTETPVTIDTTPIPTPNVNESMPGSSVLPNNSPDFGLGDNQVTVTPPPVWKHEYSDNEVASMLMKLGYIQLGDDSNGEISMDDYQAAIVSFQKDAGLPITGVADDITITRLLEKTVSFDNPH